MQIQKQCKTLKQAENYQNRLYNKYSSVQLVNMPLWVEEGRIIQVGSAQSQANLKRMSRFFAEFLGTTGNVTLVHRTR